MLAKNLSQRGTLEKFHGEEPDFIRFRRLRLRMHMQIVNPANIRVSDAFGCLDLTLEALYHAVFSGYIRTHGLKPHAIGEKQIVGFVGFSHSPGRQKFPNSESARE